MERVGGVLEVEKALSFNVACRIRASRLGRIEGTGRRDGEEPRMSVHFFTVVCVKPYIENESMAMQETLL